MIAIVSDSTVCVTRDQARAMGITVVPTNFTTGTQAYTERYMDERGPEETRELTLSPDCKTSHPPVSSFQQAFDKLMEGRTSFIVAHRLSTIRSADIILVMKDGKIIEQGNHESLLKAGGFYAKLYNSQFSV